MCMKSSPSKRLSVEGITQAENLVKVAAILNAGEIIEEKEEGKDE